MQYTPTHIKKWSIFALPALFLLLGCSPQEAPPIPPPPKVGVVTATEQSVPVYQTLSGRLSASRKAEIRARVPGILEKQFFIEGKKVKAGQKLFLIDDAPFQAALNKAQANLSKARADLQRMKPLMEANAISRQEYDAIRQLYQMAKADVKAAKINVSYAHISSPIDGVIGRALVTEGALVGQGVPTLMAVVQQTETLQIDMTQSAEDVMKLRQNMPSGSLNLAEQSIPVTIILPDGSEYSEQGKLLFTDPTVDESTGQMTLRAQVPNPNGVLFPGLFVRVKLAQAQADNVFLLPKQAVTRSGNADIALIVNKDGTFAPRPVQIIGESGQNWIVGSGLKVGEQILVEGMSKLMPGVTHVSPVPYSADQKASAPSVQNKP